MQFQPAQFAEAPGQIRIESGQRRTLFDREPALAFQPEASTPGTDSTPVRSPPGRSGTPPDVRQLRQLFFARVRFFSARDRTGPDILEAATDFTNEPKAADSRTATLPLVHPSRVEASETFRQPAQAKIVHAEFPVERSEQQRNDFLFPPAAPGNQPRNSGCFAVC